MKGTHRRLNRLAGLFHTEYGALFVFVCIAALRSWRLTRLDIFYDEAITVYEAFTWKGFFWGHYWFYPPLHGLLTAIWIKCSTHLLWIRLFSVLAGLGTVIIVYYTAKQLFTRSTAFISLILFGLSPLHVYYSREIRNYALFTLLYSACWYIFITIIDKDTTPKLIGFSLMLIALLYTHYYSGFVIAGLAGTMLMINRSWKWKTRIAVYMILAGTCYLFWVSRMLWFTDRLMNHGTYIAAPVTLKTVYHVLRIIAGGYESPTWLADGLLIVLGGLIGLSVINGKRMPALCFIGMFALPLLICLATGVIMDYNYLWPRYVAFLTVPMCLFAAHGMIFLNRIPRILITVLISGSFLLSLSFQYRNIFHQLHWGQGVRPKKEWYRSAEYIRHHYQEGDVIGHACLSSTFPYWYYLTVHYGMNHGVLLDIDHLHANYLAKTYGMPEFSYEYLAVPIEIKYLPSQYQRLWFVASEWDIDSPDSFDTQFMHLLTRNLNARFPIIDTLDYYGAPLTLYSLTESVSVSESSNRITLDAKR
ncbi:glycosyltransferase family 39 protein [bacterium]|nr:glycosyltransferase family 39 protein [candidate division CSSED10-310 bacterium]